MKVEQNFVTFYSPGTFVAETTEKPISSWDVELAKEMATGIVERYNATPYAFSFSTRTREESELDSKEVARSGFYFLGGTVETLEEIEARNDPNERILLSNMRSNGYAKVVRNINSWSWTQPLRDEDVVLPFVASRKETVNA